jgi:hypothetical protein
MNKRRIMLTFVGMVVGFRLQAKAWSGDDAVCTKQGCRPNLFHVGEDGPPRRTRTIDVAVTADRRICPAVASGSPNLLERGAEEKTKRRAFCSADALGSYSGCARAAVCEVPPHSFDKREP